MEEDYDDEFEVKHVSGRRHDDPSDPDAGGISREDWQRKMMEYRNIAEVEKPKKKARPPSAPSRRPRPMSAKREARPTSASMRSGSSSARRRPKSATSSGLPDHFVVLPPPARPLGKKKQQDVNYVETFFDEVDKSQKKKRVPKSFHYDAEDMYDEVTKLKRELRNSNDELRVLKTKLLKTQGESSRKDKQIEELLKARSAVETKSSHFSSQLQSNTLTKRLKQRVRDLERVVSEKDAEISKMKNDSRHTRVRELETELKAYYTESRRLQKVVDELTEKLRTASSAQAPPEEHQAQILQLTERNMNLKNIARTLKANYETVCQDMEYVVEENEQLKAKTEEMEKVLAMQSKESEGSETMQKELSVLRAEMQTKDDKIHDLEIELEDTKRDHDVRMKDAENAASEIKKAEMEMQAENERLKGDLTEWEEKHKASHKRAITAEEEVEKLKLELRTTQERVNELEKDMEVKDDDANEEFGDEDVADEKSDADAKTPSEVKKEKNEAEKKEDTIDDIPEEEDDDEDFAVHDVHEEHKDGEKVGKKDEGDPPEAEVSVDEDIEEKDDHL
eukprot:TRINITY_DN2191_c0_g1_i1.p1 TRINITY_DN2191_c0_g1~~TRINITY_DN2191_c0_g1_i1.p1  ORF type:complete len:564 (+),score=225.12 TRINITY_DN2191_c0_g1_i1:269-1960(+)